MDIKTKFNLNDEIISLDEKTYKATKGTVSFIGVLAHSNGDVSVTYHCKEDGVGPFTEEHSFPSEEELLNYITSKED